MRRRSGLPKQKVLYLPTFLASVSLPHSKVEGSEFSRVNGDIRLLLLAPEDPGLPYGVYPRLALMHLTTKALLQKERTFYVGESANEFLARAEHGPRGVVEHHPLQRRRERAGAARLLRPAGERGHLLVRAVHAGHPGDRFRGACRAAGRAPRGVLGRARPEGAGDGWETRRFWPRPGR